MEKLNNDEVTQKDTIGKPPWSRSDRLLRMNNEGSCDLVVPRSLITIGKEDDYINDKKKVH